MLKNELFCLLELTYLLFKIQTLLFDPICGVLFPLLFTFLISSELLIGLIFYSAFLNLAYTQ